jgi:hypothetical protein
MLTFLSDNLIRRAGTLHSVLALQACNLPPVAGLLEQRHSLALRQYTPTVSLLPEERAVVAGLERDGLFVSSLAALGLADTGIMEAGTCLADILARRVAAMGDRRPATTRAPPEDLLNHPLVYRWGLNDVLRRIIEAYLKLPLAYDGAMLFHTPGDRQERGTRRWHLDREDRRVIKVGLYLHDVNAKNGPFEILLHDLAHSGQKFRMRDYLAWDTAALESRLGVAITAQNTRAVTGPAATLVFADTARLYHRGRPAEAVRSAIFFSYFSRPPRHPFFCNRSLLNRRQIVQLVEGLSADQRASALWLDDLPPAMRLLHPFR